MRPTSRPLCLLSLIGLAGVAGAQDLVVDSGTVELGAGETYDTLLVLEPGEVIINGATILGRVDSTGSITLNEGLIVGPVLPFNDGTFPCNFGNCGELIVNGGEVVERVEVGRVEIHGGRIGDASTFGGHIQMTGGEAGALGWNSFGDTGSGSVTVTGGRLGGISGDINEFNQLSGSASVTNAVVSGSITGSARAGAIIGGSVSYGSVREGARVAGSVSNSWIVGGTIGGSARDCTIQGGSIAGGATNCNISGGLVGGPLMLPDQHDFDPPFSEPNGGLSGGQVGGIITQPFAQSLQVSNARVTGDVVLSPESSVTFNVYALIIDGTPITLPPGFTTYQNDSDETVPIDNIVMIAADGRRSEFSATLRPRDGYDFGNAIRFRGVALESGCNPADLAAPFGVIDLSDVIAFVTLYTAGDPAADFAEPFGVLDLADVVSFIDAVVNGCP